MISTFPTEKNNVNGTRYSFRSSERNSKGPSQADGMYQLFTVVFVLLYLPALQDLP